MIGTPVYAHVYAPLHFAVSQLKLILLCGLSTLIHIPTKPPVMDRKPPTPRLLWITHHPAVDLELLDDSNSGDVGHQGDPISAHGGTMWKHVDSGVLTWLLHRPYFTTSDS
ncbi:uncharacterized protein P174DRAFT_445789 [Aspergillus novofumigatus IBT 16806]|uniref:Uncharacterized protein n=1 Tax=Aspergillus novofumigatus (strain IBT 16806) TaxID=1392255 RepID=A0A2I1BUV2_ASPN1|nr:uncharacterized protein P174DRAFT_445789 [Aspergillus novofumigatus IBT 16806]PKX89170.1 hypothetical protein P174DRAFT_445789 [Aspergillus novofumigatus IBT 16806]